MDIESLDTITKAIDHASQNFGGIMNEAMTRLEAIADRYEKLIERIDGATIMFELREPK